MNWSVIGHERVKKYFVRALKEGFSSHAYVLSGNDGIGKRSLAMDVIRAAHRGSEPGVSDPFSVIISPDENGTISIKKHIRPLKRTLALRPPEGVRTFVLIDDAERLSFDASHAVLTMLEEPPAHVLFFLISSSPLELPDTIRSRCLSIRFVPPSSSEVQELLQEAGIHADQRATLGSLAGGGIGWLKNIIEQKAVGEIIKNVRGVGLILEKGKAERLAWAKKAADRDDIREIILRCMHLTREQMEQQPALSDRAVGLLGLHEALGHRNFNARLAIENFVLQQKAGVTETPATDVI